MSKIMVIDDEESVCEVLNKIFSQEGHDVVTETSSEKAYDRVVKEKPDCILMDIKMPMIGGIELLAKIKAHNKDLRIIMITGYGNIENAIESIKTGAYDYITKPFDIDFIRSVVKRCLVKS